MIFGPGYHARPFWCLQLYIERIGVDLVRQPESQLLVDPSPRVTMRALISSSLVACCPVVDRILALGGGQLALVELKSARPDVSGDEAAADMAEMVLRIFGLPREDAREVARRPLPALD